MKKWGQKVILFIAVIIITTHSFLPHLHQNEILDLTHNHGQEQDTQTNHHDYEANSEGHNNIFSFAPLDENFVPVKFQDINIELPIVYLLTPVITYHYNFFREKSKTHFGYYKEYPPPCTHPSDYNRRGPPSLLG